MTDGARDGAGARGPGQGAVVRVESLSKRYGSVVALDAVDLRVFPGEVVALVGPNGAGKSTLLKVLAGLIWPSEGDASIGGHRAGSLGAKRLIGFLPQRVFLQEGMELREVLQLFAQLRVAGRSAAERAVASCIDAVGLGDVQHRLVRELSGGMVQRAALAQVLLGEPPVLLLDEPALNLDVEGRHRLRSILEHLRTRGGCAVVSSHLLEDVMHTADRVLILQDGRVIADEPVEAVAGRLEERVHVAVDDAGGARLLLERMGVRVGTNSGGHLVLHCSAGDAAVLLAELNRAGYVPRAYRTGLMSLEELVMSYLAKAPAGVPHAGRQAG